MKIKTAVLVSGGGTNLQALIDAEKSGIFTSGTLALVASNNPNAYALERAKKAGIKTLCVDRNQLGGQSGFEAKLIDALDENGIQLIILAGFMCILSGSFTKRFENRIINVHPSLIPSFCGKGCYGIKVHEKALEYGVKVTGATVHYVNEIPDGGKIILQKAVEIREEDTPKTLQKRVMEEAEWKILPQAAELIAKKLAENN